MQTIAEDGKLPTTFRESRERDHTRKTEAAYSEEEQLESMEMLWKLNMIIDTLNFKRRNGRPNLPEN